MSRRLSLRQLRHGSGVVEQLRIEWGCLAGACVSAGLSGRGIDTNGWQYALPRIESDLQGFERQCVAGLVMGLDALHPREVVAPVVHAKVPEPAKLAAPYRFGEGLVMG